MSTHIKRRHITWNAFFVSIVTLYSFYCYQLQPGSCIRCSYTSLDVFIDKKKCCKEIFIGMGKKCISNTLDGMQNASFYACLCKTYHSSWIDTHTHTPRRPIERQKQNLWNGAYKFYTMPLTYRCISKLYIYLCVYVCVMEKTTTTYSPGFIIMSSYLTLCSTIGTRVSLSYIDKYY